MASKVGYNAHMINPDADSNLTEADFGLMDEIFKAGWELGQSNLNQTPGEALIMFKMLVVQPDLAKKVDKNVKAGMAKTRALYAADAKKSAEMN